MRSTNEMGRSNMGDGGLGGLRLMHSQLIQGLYESYRRLLEGFHGKAAIVDPKT